MSSFSARMNATALRLLTAYGTLIPCHKVNVDTFNPDSGEATTLGRTDYDAYGYASNYNLNQIDGTLVISGDILLILSSTTIPEINDICEVNGTTFTFLNVENITAQGSNVVYKIQLRK